jgi:hypothetical protein
MVLVVLVMTMNEHWYADLRHRAAIRIQACWRKNKRDKLVLNNRKHLESHWLVQTLQSIFAGFTLLFFPIPGFVYIVSAGTPGCSLTGKHLPLQLKTPLLRSLDTQPINLL